MAVDTTAARSRRALLTAGLGAAAAAVASALGRPMTARAANGDPLLVGQTTIATAETTLSQTDGTAPGLSVAINNNGATGYAFRAAASDGTGALVSNRSSNATVHATNIGALNPGPAVFAMAGTLSAFPTPSIGTVIEAIQNDSGPGRSAISATSPGTNAMAIRADGGNGAGLEAVGARVGVLATNPGNGTAVLGVSGSASVTPAAAVGVYGYAGQDANARGVLGSSPAGTGVYGASTTGIGLRGVSTSNTGLRGDSTTGTAVRAFSTGGRAVNATAGSFTAAAITSQMTSTKSAVQGFTGPGAVPAPTNETGVEGRCDLSVNSNGIYGQSADGNGVFGSSDTGYGVLGLGYFGLWGSGAAGVVGDVDGGTGVQGWTGTAFAPDPLAHVGVWAGAEDGRIALQVAGVAKLSRSGRVSFSSGQSSKTVSVPGGITTASLGLANLQSNRTGIYVQAVVPSATGSSITIYLNKAVTSTTVCGWTVIN